MKPEPMLYPVNLDISGRRCLVVGGGKIAARKVQGLLPCGAEILVVAPEITADISAHEGVVCEERPYVSEDVRGSWLVFAATGDSALNAQVARDAEEAAIWVNVVSSNGGGSFMSPAVVRRGSLLATVSTGGASPGFAAFLKEQLSNMMVPEYETALELLRSERNTRIAGGYQTETLDWKGLLNSDLLELIRTGDMEQAKQRVRAWL